MLCLCGYKVQDGHACEGEEIPVGEDFLSRAHAGLHKSNGYDKETKVAGIYSRRRVAVQTSYIHSSTLFEVNIRRCGILID